MTAPAQDAAAYPLLVSSFPLAAGRTWGAESVLAERRSQKWTAAVGLQPANPKPDRHLGALSLPNRVVMAPMSSRLADDQGFVTAERVAFVHERALGGTGDPAVVVYRDGETGCETAEFLAKHGTEVKRVTGSGRKDLAQGRAPVADLLSVLRHAGVAATAIGDAQAIGRIGDAVHAAHDAMAALLAESQHA